MTEFIPVTPLKVMPFLSRGRYHFCQAHLFETLEESNVWSWMDHNSKSLILDNGSFELQGVPAVKPLYRVAKRLHPFEVVCPDAFQDKDKTLKLFHAHALDLSKLATRVMIVPHGKDVVEWIDCLETMLNSKVGEASGNFTIGVPKVLDSYPGGRSSVLAWIEEHLDVPRHNYLGHPIGYDVHLLGMWKWLSTPVQIISSFPWIRSWDSTWPYACAVAGNYSLDNAPKVPIGDWYPEYLPKDVVKLAEVNIAICKKATSMACEEGKRRGHG